MTKKPTQHKVKATIQADVEITIDADHHLEAKEELKTHLTKELGLKKVSINFISTTPISEESGTSPSSLENDPYSQEYYMYGGIDIE